jgi:hypothetical protein
MRIQLEFVDWVLNPTLSSQGIVSSFMGLFAVAAFSMVFLLSKVLGFYVVFPDQLVFKLEIQVRAMYHSVSSQ